MSTGTQSLRRNKNASSLSLNDADRYTISINVEFLDRCDYHCPGCFVNRRNSYTTEDLLKLKHLAKQYTNIGAEVNEIILGPTDLFGCKNAEEILTDPDFISLFDDFQALTFNTVLQSDVEHIKNILDIIDRLYPKTLNLEVFIVVDIDKFAAGDINYLQTLDNNLKLLKGMNIIFAVNVHNNDIFKSKKYVEIADYIAEKYDSNLKMVPSFFRSQKTSLILDNLIAWKEDINKNIDSSATILNSVSDLFFGGHTYAVYTYKEHQLYLNPAIYDFVFDHHPNLVVPTDEHGNYNIDDVFQFETQKIKEQYIFSNETSACSSCYYLPSCASKKILSFMENRGIIDCFLPKEIIDYNNKVNSDEDKRKNKRAME